jgi:hypothetical protein
MNESSQRRSVLVEMRLPVRSETEAFQVAVAGAVVIVASAVIGVLTEPVVGAAVFAAACIAALVVYLRAGNPDRPLPLRDAVHAEHPRGAPPGRRHVLVVANEPLSGNELSERILGDRAADVEVDVLAPVLLSRVHAGVSDIDYELTQARARLERSLRWAREHGIVARGDVGDPSAPTAIADELRDFGADEVIVVTHPFEHETWQEREQLERLRGELEIPITQFVGDDDGVAIELAKHNSQDDSKGEPR